MTRMSHAFGAAMLGCLVVAEVLAFAALAGAPQWARLAIAALLTALVPVGAIVGRTFLGDLIAPRKNVSRPPVTAGKR